MPLRTTAIRAPLPTWTVRIEVLTTISGVSFDECFPQRTIAEIDGIPVNLISLEHLKINKRASGRLKDLADLDYLP